MKKGKNPQKWNKRKSTELRKSAVRTSGETNMPPSWLAQFAQAGSARRRQNV